MLATVAFAGLIVVFLGLALIAYASLCLRRTRGRPRERWAQEDTYFWTFGAAGLN
jgi:hypothetical protein